MQSNEDKTITLLRFELDDPTYGLPTAYWWGSPEYVVEADWICGFIVTETAPAEHAGQPAVRFGLADSNGLRKVGRLVLATDCLRDAGLEFVRTYDSVEEMREDIEILTSGGWRKRPARTLMTGDEVRTGTMTSVPLTGELSDVIVTPRGQIEITVYDGENFESACLALEDEVLVKVK